MVATIKEYTEGLWWLLILQGVATIIFGLLALVAPGATLVTAIFVLAIYSIIIGVIDLVHAFSSIGRDRTWWVPLVLGLILLAIGIYILRNPVISIGTFILTVGIILFARGIFDLVAAAFFSAKDNHRWLMAISGVFGVLAGVFVWANPITGGLAFVWVVGLYALVTGAMTISYALHMKGLFEEMKREMKRTLKSSKPEPSKKARA